MALWVEVLRFQLYSCSLSHKGVPILRELYNSVLCDTATSCKSETCCLKSLYISYMSLVLVFIFNFLVVAVRSLSKSSSPFIPEVPYTKTVQQNSTRNACSLTALLQWVFREPAGAYGDRTIMSWSE